MSAASDFFGAQGSVPVGTVLPINTRENLYVGADKSEWLRSGVVETDIASYPHAFVSYEGGGNPTSEASRFTLSILTAGQLGYSISGITGEVDMAWDYDRNFWYILEKNTDIVFQFTEHGISTGVSFNLTTDPLVTESTFTGIAYYSGRLYVVGNSTDTGYRFRPDGTYDGLQFPTNVGGGSQSNPSGIAVQSTGIFIVDKTADKISKYGLDGVYSGAGNDIDISGQALNVDGLAVSADGLKYFVVDSTLGKVFRYTSAGYDNFNFTPLTQDNNVAGIEIKGTDIHVHGQQYNFVYKYDSAGNYKVPVGDTVIQPRGIYFDTTNIYYYVADTNASVIYRFDTDLTYTGWSFNHNPAGIGGTPKPRGITIIDTDFWVLDSNFNDTDEQGLYKYNSAGAYTGFFIDTRGVIVKPRDMASDGINMFILSFDGDVYEYTPDGVYTGRTFNLRDNAPFWAAIHYDIDSQAFWCLSIEDDTLYQYTSAGEYTGNHFKTQSPAPVSFAIRDNENFEVMDAYGSGITKLAKEKGVGLLNASNSASGARNYVRIK